MVEKAEQITELENQLAVACYERDGLQTRLDLIRSRKDELVFLLDTSTLKEHLEAGGEVVDWVGAGRKLG